MSTEGHLIGTLLYLSGSERGKDVLRILRMAVSHTDCGSVPSTCSEPSPQRWRVDTYTRVATSASSSA